MNILTSHFKTQPEVLHNNDQRKKDMGKKIT